MKKQLFAVAFIALAQLFTLTTAFADVAWLGGTGSNASSPDGQSPDIQMVNETINLEIHPAITGVAWDSSETKDFGHTDVDVEYLFKNHSTSEVTVKMGFPESCDDSSMGDCELYDFKTFVNGQEVGVTLEPGEIDPTGYSSINWHISSVTFAPNEEKTIRNTYWVSPSRYKTGNWTNYTLETGATWKGVIEEVNIIAKFVPPVGGVQFSPHTHLTAATPDGFVYDTATNSIKWQLKNLEPTSDHNIMISYNRPGEAPFGCLSFPEDSVDMASSTLATEGEVLMYYPCMSHDGDANTAWVEGVSGDGVGEWLQIPLQPDKTYDKFLFSNGYMKDEALWAKNNRVKKAKLTFEDNANFSQIVEFQDVYGTQEITLSEAITHSEYAELRILEVYPGSEFDDTAISEIQFIGELKGKAEEVFSDIEGHEFETAINFIQERGIVEGYTDGTYRPDALINRAEFTKIIIEAFHPGSANGSNCFPDVHEEWFAQYVCYAKTQSIITGYPDSTFKPANNINLVESLKIIFESFGAEVPAPKTGEQWYQPYVDGMNALAAPETLNPNDFSQSITRGEMANLIYTVLSE